MPDVRVLAVEILCAFLPVSRPLLRIYLRPYLQRISGRMLSCLRPTACELSNRSLLSSALSIECATQYVAQITKLFQKIPNCVHTDKYYRTNVHKLLRPGVKNMPKSAVLYGI